MGVQSSSRCGGVVLCLALVAALCGCGGAAGNAVAEPAAAQDEALAVRAVAASVSPMASLYSTSATLRAERRATVIARTAGVIRELRVEEGDRVTAGSTLAVLEDDEQRIELQRTAAAAETLGRELERAAELHRQGMLADEAFEQSRRAAEEARHAADLAELILSRTVIRAPFGGRILARHVDAGASVSNGSPVFDLADLDPLYADVSVPERQVARLARGQEVRVVGDASDTASGARIERIAPAVDPATGTVKVTLTVPAAPGLRPGSFVRVDIVTETHEQALVVPRSALVAEGRRWHVFRVGTDGRAERVEVVRGFEEGERVEILETVSPDAALAPGDRVVHVGASALSDGSAVHVVEDEPAGDAPQASRGGGDGGVGAA